MNRLVHNLACVFAGIERKCVESKRSPANETAIDYQVDARAK